MGLSAISKLRRQKFQTDAVSNHMIWNDDTSQYGGTHKAVWFTESSENYVMYTFVITSYYLYDYFL